MIIIALGANLPSRFGAPLETLAAAQRALAARGLALVSASRIWLTAPVPVSDQPWYHNAVVGAETVLPPAGVLDVLQSIECDFGRVRAERNAPRILDLDLIAYHDEILEQPGLAVPHPRMHERAFVLRPMQEIAPGDWRHPVLGKTLAELVAALPEDQDARPMERAA